MVMMEILDELLTPWLAESRLLATPAWIKLKGVSGHWLVQHTAPVRAKPDGRPRLEGAHYKYTTRCSLFPTYPSSTLHVTHTLAHTYQYPSSSCASARDYYDVSALKSRVGWTSTRNDEWTNERYMRTDRRTYTQTRWSQYFAHLPGAR